MFSSVGKLEVLRITTIYVKCPQETQKGSLINYSRANVREAVVAGLFNGKYVKEALHLLLYLLTFWYVSWLKIFTISNIIIIVHIGI